jgi:hypothetical protein
MYDRFYATPVKPALPTSAFPRRPHTAGPSTPSQASEGVATGFSFRQLPIFAPTLRGQLSEPVGEAADTAVVEPDSAPEPAEEAEPLQGATGCPLTADLLSFGVGNEKANCRVPEDKHGVSRLAKYMVRGHDGKTSLTVSEQFKALEDPYNVFAALKPNTYATEKTGHFDDCYSIYTKDPLPPDFVLKVEQNHMVNGQVISKVHITFSPTGIRVCAFKRKPGSCDFKDICRK